MYYGRGKNKAQNPYTFKSMYEEYIKDKEEYSPYHVSYSTFISICEEFYKDVAEYILEGGLYYMPYRLGTVSVVAQRPKKLDKYSLSPDWKATADYGKLIMHLNDHSNYYKYKFYWSKTDCRIKNKSKYRLVFTRANKRKLASIIKAGDYEYFEI